MDDQRVGAAFRAVRIKRGWRQRDVAQRAGVTHGAISLLERGHVDRVSIRTLRRVASEMEIRVDLALKQPHGELDRLVNAGHAALHEALARFRNELPGWVHAPEVSFAIYGERGVIDILAFHEPKGSLLVIELKTELVSLEGLLATMDVRLRHAATIARERGWIARTVSAWVVIAESRTNPRRVAAHGAALRSALATDGRTMRAWLKRPRGAVRALSFWTDSNVIAARRIAAARRRVRVLEAGCET